MLGKIKIGILKFVFKIMAKMVLWRHKPYIIGITGSIGKTTTKEAIYHLVKTKFKTRESKKNFNNEIGLPLTVIGFEGGISSVFDLFSVCKKWMKAFFGKNYPEMLVLEMGVDRVNDMEYLCSIVKLDIAVVSCVASVHREFFDSIDEIAKEKGKIVENLKENSEFKLAILNEDDVRVKKMANRTKGKVATYGFLETADFSASDITHIFETGKFQGLSFKLNYEGKTIPIRLNYVLADYHIYSILAGICVAVNLKMNVIDLAEYLASFRPPIGRMNLLEGINSSTIIDDTYNSAPKSTESAIKMFAKIPSERKIAVLGDMLELGDDSKNDHEKIVNCLGENKIDKVFLVGKRMKEAGEKVMLENENCQFEFFDNPMSAGKKVKEIVELGDVVLVKGSQGMRMEKVVEQLIQDKENMKNLLCRQDEVWKNKEFRMP